MILLKCNSEAQSVSIFIEFYVLIDVVIVENSSGKSSDRDQVARGNLKVKRENQKNSTHQMNFHSEKPIGSVTFCRSSTRWFPRFRRGLLLILALCLASLPSLVSEKFPTTTCVPQQKFGSKSIELETELVHFNAFLKGLRKEWALSDDKISENDILLLIVDHSVHELTANASFAL